MAGIGPPGPSVAEATAAGEACVERTGSRGKAHSCRARLALPNVISWAWHLVMAVSAVVMCVPGQRTNKIVDVFWI